MNSNKFVTIHCGSVTILKYKVWEVFQGKHPKVKVKSNVPFSNPAKIFYRKKLQIAPEILSAKKGVIVTRNFILN